MSGNQIKHIGVLTSGGDSPGMNACIRAVVRSAIYKGIKVTGIMRGFQGMIEGDFIPLESGSVSNIIQRGGTILKSARCKEFMEVKGRETAAQNLKKEGIEAVVVIGGDGSFKGALALQNESGIPMIGIPGTIDNDLTGTDYTLGYDTALNTVVEAVDKLRDTAASHDRLFIVEVMGRDAGLIALRSGIAVGAEAILIPETKTDFNHVISILEHGWNRQKTSAIMIVCEGDEAGGAYEVSKEIKKRIDSYEVRISVLGHIQRGGNPTCLDRVLASRMGMASVDSLLEGKAGNMVGIVKNEITLTPFEQATKKGQIINEELLRLAEILST